MSFLEQFKLVSKTTAFRIFLHVGFWLIYLSAPIIQYSTLTEFSNTFLWLTFVVNIVFALFYYPFAYWIVPRFFKWEKMHLFLIATISLYILFFYTTKQIQSFAVSHYRFSDYDISYINQSINRNIFFLPFLLELIIVTSIPLTLKVLRRFYALQDEKDELEKLNNERTKEGKHVKKAKH